MSVRLSYSHPAYVLAVLLLLPASAPAQSVEPDDSDSLAPGPQVQVASATKPDLERTGELITQMTNEFRSRHGRGRLSVNPELVRTAQDFADYLARTDTFSHTADGKQPSQRVREHGYRFCLVAENIAWEYNSAGFTTPALARAFVAGWRHSPGHRKNMLDGDLDEIGVGVARSAKTGRYYAVQDFGRPRSKAVVFRITNDTDEAVRYTLDGQSFTLKPHFTVTHTRCRSPEVDFQESRGKAASDKDAEETFHPKGGAQFTVRGGRADGFTVEER
jgi:uncharacterized protein YkwD